MPLNALTIFAVVFLVMGATADVISLVGEGKKYYNPAKTGLSAIPMVGFVFYAISCFVFWLYLPWQTVAWAMCGLTVFHLVCQFTFFFMGKKEVRQP